MQSWLAGGNTTLNVDAKVADHIVKNANAKLKEAVRRNFEDPESHLHWFSECIHYIDSFIFRFSERNKTYKKIKLRFYTFFCLNT